MDILKNKIKKFLKENALLILLIATIDLLLVNILIIGLDYNKELIYKNEQLTKIIKAEYGKTFESYEEFLYYQNRKGEKNEIQS